MMIITCNQLSLYESDRMVTQLTYSTGYNNIQESTCVTHSTPFFFAKFLPPPYQSDDDCIPACAEFEKIRKMSRLETLQGYV